MAEYAKSAYSRGIKVAIASAGGAASLAPMLAAFAPRVPVIGLPIKPTIGDGMDSILSMLNVPKGTPVATMALNNSTNAALLAARILAGWDEDLAEKVQAYAVGTQRSRWKMTVGCEREMMVENDFRTSIPKFVL